VYKKPPLLIVKLANRTIRSDITHDLDVLKEIQGLERYFIESQNWLNINR